MRTKFIKYIKSFLGTFLPKPASTIRQNIKNHAGLPYDNNELLNTEYIKNIILKDASWEFSHGASDGYIGLGILYYGFVYILKAKVAVCLGSGGGFVPRIMRQAQRDLGMGNNSRTIIVDANSPEAGFGTPDYLDDTSFFKTQFSDVKIVVQTTKDAARIFEDQNIKIDYLHIDADHTQEGTIFDYEAYRPLMADRFIITIHDTRFSPGVIRAIEQLRQKKDIELINFNYLGYGLAIIKHNLSQNVVANPALKAAAFSKHPILHGVTKLKRIKYIIQRIISAVRSPTKRTSGS